MLGILLIMAIVVVSGILFRQANGSGGSALPTGSNAAITELATFAGGCFWCMEQPFEGIEGVISVISGYTGGTEVNPTYKAVSSGRTGHAEAIQVKYDPSRVSYGTLLDLFWRQIDPTDGGGQFTDRGSQYRTGIFYHNEEQQREAEESKAALERSGMFDEPIVTEIGQIGKFYPAEDYHQDYFRKCPIPYKTYKRGSGRESFIMKVWGEAHSSTREGFNAENFQKPSETEIEEKLTPLQYDVTQRNGTERAFSNEYYYNKREGIYVDIVSGEPLFSSKDKYESGSGWPSFTRPLEKGNIVERHDGDLGIVRTEIRSAHADSHLGHKFKDGPEPTGLRYCINSASLRFIAREDMEKEGYGEYLSLFNLD